MAARILAFLIAFLVCSTGALAQLPATPLQYQPQPGYTMTVTDNLLVKYVPSWIGANSITASVVLKDSADTLQTISSASGSVNVTLPPAVNTVVATKGHPMCFKVINVTNPISLLAGAGDTIDGAGSVSLTVLNQAVILESDGTHTWRVLLNTATVGGVNSVSNGDGTLTISPTTGAVVASIPSSVALPGNPTTTTQAPGNSTTRIATTAFVANAVSGGSVASATGINGLVTNGARNTPATGAVVFGPSAGVAIGDALNLPHWCNIIGQLQANQSSTPPRILFVGDSITVGGGYAVAGFPNQIAYRLQRAGINTILNGFTWPGGTGMQPSEYSLGTGWANAGGFGPCGTSGVKGIVGVATGDMNFTHQATMTGGIPEPNTFSVQILYTASVTGASASLEVPPGFPVATLTPTAGTISSITVSGNTSTYRVKAPTGSGDVTIVGTLCLPGSNASGIWDHLPNMLVCSNAGQSGTKVGDWNNAAFTGLISSTQPTTVVLALMANDSTTGTAVNTWKSGIQSMITTCQAAGADVVLVSCNPSGPGTTFFATQQSYVAALQDLANTNHCVLVDMFDRWVDFPTAVANGFMTGGDNLHPTTNGAYDYAAAIFEPLSQAAGLRGSKLYMDLTADVGGSLLGSRIGQLSTPLSSLAQGSAVTSDVVQWNGSLWTNSPGLQYVSVPISSAEWLNLNAVPKVLVSAPGAGKSIIPVSWELKMTTTATQYVGGGNPLIQWNGGVAASNTIPAAVVTAGAGTSDTMRMGIDATPTQNAALVFTNQTANFTVGTGTAVVNLFYYAR